MIPPLPKMLSPAAASLSAVDSPPNGIVLIGIAEGINGVANAGVVVDGLHAALGAMSGQT